MSSTPIRVQLPYHLRTLARIDGDVVLEVAPPITLAAVLDAVELRYPMLAGTIRDHDTRQRRPFLRFFACEEDISLQPPDTPLPIPVAEGREPLLIIGAIAGGSFSDRLPRVGSSSIGESVHPSPLTRPNLHSVQSLGRTPAPRLST